MNPVKSVFLVSWDWREKRWACAWSRNVGAGFTITSHGPGDLGNPDPSEAIGIDAEMEPKQREQHLLMATVLIVGIEMNDEEYGTVSIEIHGEIAIAKID